jgi:outer membrane protein assembly factor BamB
MKSRQALKNRLRVVTIATVLIVFLSFWTTTSFAENAASLTDWPQWRGPNRDGISGETGWLTMWPEGGPERLWKTQVGTGYSSVAVSDGRVYTIGNKKKTDTIYCLDADTGTEIWTYSYPCVGEGKGYPGPASTPTVDGGHVYTLSREGHFFCLDAKSGKVIWSRHVVEDFGAKTPEWEYASSPLILDNMVIVDAGMALAVDRATGNLIWKTKDYGGSCETKDQINGGSCCPKNQGGVSSCSTGNQVDDSSCSTNNRVSCSPRSAKQGGGYSSLTAFQVNGSQRLAAFPSSGLVILDPKDGRELASHAWKTSCNTNTATPIISGDRIFISSGFNVGCALLRINGDKLSVMWQNKNMRNNFTTSVLWEGHLYGFDESRLRCLDWETGDVKWTKGGLGKGSLMLADGKLIILSDRGKLVIAEASQDGFVELASTRVLKGLCWTLPVLSGGRIYCRNHDGDLVCVDVSGSGQQDRVKRRSRRTAG